MKKIFVLSVLTSVAMICACQKKDSAAEEQLTRPKTEQGARDEALAERLNQVEEKVNRLDQTVRELAEKQQATTNTRMRHADVQPETSDPAQVQAENEKMMQQLSTLISHASHGTAGDPGKQQRPGQRQLGPEDLQRQWQDKTRMSGKAVFPSAESASPTAPPGIETTSPVPSPTPG